MTDFTPAEGVEYTYSLVYPYDEAFTTIDAEGYTDGTVSISAVSETAFDDVSHIKGALYGVETATGNECPVIQMHHLSHIMKVSIENLTGINVKVTKVSMETDAEVSLGGTYNVNMTNGSIKAVDEPATKADINVLNGSLNITHDNYTATVATGEKKSLYVLTPEFTIPSGKKLSFTVTCENGDAVVEKVADAEIKCAAGGIRTAEIRLDGDTFIPNNLYVMGGHLDWNSERFVELVKYGRGLFRGIVYMNGQYKLLPTKTGWFAPAYTQGNGTFAYHSAAQDTENNTNFTASEGVYNMEVNLLAKTVTLTPAESTSSQRFEQIYFGGGVTDWTRIPMTNDPMNPNLWYYGGTLNTVAGSDFKFTAEDNWNQANGIFPTYGNAWIGSTKVVVGGTNDYKWKLSDNELGKTYKIYLKVIN